MTPPSTQNLKALGFLLNVGLRLTLGYLTISFFHIGTLSLNTTTSRTLLVLDSNTICWENPWEWDLNTGDISPERMWDLDSTPERSHKNENWVKTHIREWHLPSTQNLKALDLWVFLICCSTISFLLNVRLRLTLEYLTNLPQAFSFHIASYQAVTYLRKRNFKKWTLKNLLLTKHCPLENLFHNISVKH